MLFIKYFLALIPGAIAAAMKPVHRCSTPDLSHETIMEHDAAYAELANSSNHSLASTDVVIPTYVHIVTTDAKRYKYTFDQINRQIALLNRVYNFMGISFNVEEIDFTVNNGWAAASAGSQTERQMRTFLQKQIAHYTTLNLYFLSNFGEENGESILGLCRFPVANPTYDNYLFDGCLNGAETLPGGDNKQYSLGYTAAHEVGHWFDLYHPFMGQNCASQNDLVSDTPAQSTPSFGCAFGKDTCPDYPGLDNIHNIMDYSDDSCLIRFTSGQAERARAAYTRYRLPRA